MIYYHSKSSIAACLAGRTCCYVVGHSFGNCSHGRGKNRSAGLQWFPLKTHMHLRRNDSLTDTCGFENEFQGISVSSLQNWIPINTSNPDLHEWCIVVSISQCSPLAPSACTYLGMFPVCWCRIIEQRPIFCLNYVGSPVLERKYYWS